MAWMTDPHAEQILRGLYPEQYGGWSKVWLRYGFVVLLAGIAAGGTFLKMRPSSPPIAAATPEVVAAPKTTISFPSLFTADLPRMGWRNPEVEKMRRLLSLARERRNRVQRTISGCPCTTKAPGGNAATSVGFDSRSARWAQCPARDPLMPKVFREFHF
jgi:hypothetical protein